MKFHMNPPHSDSDCFGICSVYSVQYTMYTVYNARCTLSTTHSVQPDNHEIKTVRFPSFSQPKMIQLEDLFTYYYTHGYLTS